MGGVAAGPVVARAGLLVERRGFGVAPVAGAAGGAEAVADDFWFGVDEEKRGWRTAVAKDLCPKAKAVGKAARGIQLVDVPRRASRDPVPDPHRACHVHTAGAPWASFSSGMGSVEKWYIFSFDPMTTLKLWCAVGDAVVFMHAVAPASENCPAGHATQ